MTTDTFNRAIQVYAYIVKAKAEGKSVMIVGPDGSKERLLAKKAGVKTRRVSPHVLRHAFATLSRDAGARLEDIQDALNHADPRTTRRYDRGGQRLDRSPAYTLAAYLTGH